MPEEKHDMFVKKEEEPTSPPFKKSEETNDNPGEEETPEEETSSSEQETEEKPEGAEDNYEDEVVTKKEFNKLYARMKTAEEKAKKAESKAKPVSDVDAILEVQNATKGLEPEEVKELQLRAKASSISLSEARDNENFKLWQEGRRIKVEKDKALNPSTNQSETEDKKPMSVDARLKEAQEKYRGNNVKIQEETAKILSEARFKSPQTGEVKMGMNPLKRFDK